MGIVCWDILIFWLCEQTTYVCFNGERDIEIGPYAMLQSHNFLLL